MRIYLKPDPQSSAQGFAPHKVVELLKKLQAPQVQKETLTNKPFFDIASSLAESRYPEFPSEILQGIDCVTSWDSINETNIIQGVYRDGDCEATVKTDLMRGGRNVRSQEITAKAPTPKAARDYFSQVLQGKATLVENWDPQLQAAESQLKERLKPVVELARRLLQEKEEPHRFVFEAKQVCAAAELVGLTI